VVPGGPATGRALVAGGVDVVSFTGSSVVGREVAALAAAHLVPTLLELGGKHPMVVLGDADPVRAARGAVWAGFLNAGQACVAVERVYVVAEAYDAFVAALRTAVAEVEASSHPARGIGPVFGPGQIESVEAQVAEALAAGATLLAGGKRAGESFYEPTVLLGVDHSMAVMREETFGPVLPVLAVGSLDEAIRLANDSPYGLTASGWTRSAATAARLQRELQAGVVTINDCVASFAEPAAPWGGIKASGIGRTHGRLGLLEMTQPRFVSLDRGRGAELWWYPYDRELEEILATTAPALHARTLRARLAAQLRLLAWRRVRERVGLRRLLGQLEKLF